MIIFSNINPVALQVGPLSIHWYGLMYLFGFFGGWLLLSYRIRHTSHCRFTKQQLSDLVFYIAMGVIIGGRLGYMIFYDWVNFFHSPLKIFMVWHGGMSFHGGVIGVTIALLLFCKNENKNLGEVGDFIVPVIPFGLCLGRIGNFINGELWGKVTNGTWGVVFPYAGDLPRHPSQLYEAFLEGAVLFIILWIYSNKPRPAYSVSGLFFIFYGVFRFSVEFFREPDQQIGYLAWGWLTEGQVLSIPLIVVGILFMITANRRKLACNNI